MMIIYGRPRRTHARAIPYTPQVGKTASPGLPTLMRNFYGGIDVFQFGGLAPPSACLFGSNPFAAEVGEMGLVLALEVIALGLVVAYRYRQDTALSVVGGDSAPTAVWAQTPRFVAMTSAGAIALARHVSSYARSTRLSSVITGGSSSKSVTAIAPPLALTRQRPPPLELVEETSVSGRSTFFQLANPLSRADSTTPASTTTMAHGAQRFTMASLAVHGASSSKAHSIVARAQIAAPTLAARTRGVTDVCDDSRLDGYRRGVDVLLPQASRSRGPAAATESRRRAGGVRAALGAHGAHATHNPLARATATTYESEPPSRSEARASQSAKSTPAAGSLTSRSRQLAAPEAQVEGGNGTLDTCNHAIAILTRVAFTILTLVYPLVVLSSLRMIDCAPTVVPVLAYAAMDQDGSSLQGAAAAIVQRDADGTAEISPTLIFNAAQRAALSTDVHVLTLVADPYYACFQASHRPAGAIAIATVILFVVGYPLVTLIWVRRRVAAALASLDTRSRRAGSGADGLQAQ